MSFEYLTNEGYRTYWLKLEGMRFFIARDLQLTPGMRILDVGTGWGLFAIEMAKQLERGEIVGIDIAPEDIDKARELVSEAGVADIVKVQKMDATKLSFPDDHFDLATSFLGMRDIHMTRGEEGVRKATEEMVRVTKPSGRIALCITPPEDAETEDQRIAIEVEGKVFGAKSMPKEFYSNIFEANNVVLKKMGTYYTGKKLSAEQAKTELKEGIEIAEKVYGKNIPPFKKVWDTHGRKIEAVGYGMYSKVVMLIGEKAT